jgi:hypothetical protein
MKDIVIYPNKRSLIGMAAGCSLFVGASLYFIIYGYNISGRDALGQFFKAITPEIFYIGAPLFSLLLIYICYRLLKPAPSVIINEEGIFDNASLFGAGMIRWEEIESMFIYKIMDNPFLGIIPVSLETILARQSSIKRFFFKMNKGMTQAPFAIPESVLPMSVEELLAKIQLYRSSHSQDRAYQVVQPDRE